MRSAAPHHAARPGRRFVLVAFFALTYLLAWSVWIPAGLLAPDATGFVLLGAWAPTVAALLLTWRGEGRRGVRRLLGALLRWRVDGRLYAAAILGMPAAALLAVGVHAALGGTPPELAAIAARFGFPAERATLFLLFTPLVYLSTVFVGGPIAEEIGWRGFAHPRLAARVGAGPAGLVVGLLWSLWHLPLFVFDPSAVGGLPLALYVPLITALGVLFAWLAERSGGSVLPCILLHAGVNFTLGVVGAGAFAADGQLLAIFVVLVGALALLAFLRLRKRPTTERLE